MKGIMNDIWKTIGFENIKKVFINLEKKSNLGHAYLFSGQDMIGKRTFAMELVSKIKNLNGAIEKHPDIFYISGGGEDGKIAIEKIRELKKFIYLKPYSAPYKFAIIDEAHQITQEAGNSILKILEEPPASSILILISSKPSQLLPTILSRCEIIKFSPHPKDILKNYFKTLKLTDEQIDFLVNFSNGRIGLAISLYEKESFSMIRKVIEDFVKFIKSPVHKRFNFIENLLAGRLDYDIETAILYWIFYLRSPASNKIRIEKQRILKKLIKAHHYIHQSQLNHRLLMESNFLNL